MTAPLMGTEVTALLTAQAASMLPSMGLVLCQRTCTPVSALDPTRALRLKPGPQLLLAWGSGNTAVCAALSLQHAGFVW